MGPEVSVIIPTHDRAHCLEETIQGVFDQTFQDFELIVVDDGSTDCTTGVLAPYRDRLRYLRQERTGRSVARNRGALVSRGRYLAFLDSDDVWMPDKLERQFEAARRVSGFGVMHGAVEVIDEDSRPLPEVTRRFQRGFLLQHSRRQDYPRLVLHHEMYTSTTLIPRDVFMEVGMYDPDLEPREDCDLYLRIARKYEVISLGLPAVCLYRESRGDLTHPPDVSEVYTRLHLKHLRMTAARRTSKAGINRRNLLIALARDAYAGGDPAGARSWLARAAVCRPESLVHPAFAALAVRSALPAGLKAALAKLLPSRGEASRALF
jgi:glycosyltransferase involved in cell wall biosynthesis